MPAAVAIPAIIGAAGVGASLYGAKKQSDAAKKASDANAASVDATNALNYQQWLESRGVGANGQAINTKLPRWAMWKMPAKTTPMAGATPIKL